MAEQLFLKAAEQGHARAQFTLGCCYGTSIGVEQNDEEAFKWYLKAAESGLASAQYYLGDMYLSGRCISVHSDTDALYKDFDVQR
ncbi:hypothetical protein BGW42_007316 [Actinomortierella wolfii]|nr:hypothetical protein BGW42_007316 [Actinomortierella wolfii]